MSTKESKSLTSKGKNVPLKQMAFLPKAKPNFLKLYTINPSVHCAAVIIGSRSRCDKFRKQSLEERQKFIQDKKLCSNSLAPGHFVRACQRDSFCRGGSRKFRKRGPSPPPSTPPPLSNGNFTFQDMQHTALWVYS